MDSKNAEWHYETKEISQKITYSDLGRKHKITRHLSERNPSVVTKDGRMYI